MEKDWLRKKIDALIGDGRKFRSRSEAARFLGLPQTQATRFFDFLDGSNTQYISVLDWLEKLGGKIVFVDDPTPERDVCFIDAKTVEAANGKNPTHTENFLAVPMVGEVGAGPGIIPNEYIRSWVLVARNHKSVAMRSNLLAVEIGNTQRSMSPTLNPGDIVLVDRNDWGQTGYQSPGNIFLVREPGQDGGGKVKRVSLSGKGESAILTFYSDNQEENEPEPHILSRDYDSNIRSAIVGRVVWAWADLSKK